MANLVRTEADLLTTLFQDGQANNSITAQDMRDFIVSVPTLAKTGAAGTWSIDITGDAAGLSATLVETSGGTGNATYVTGDVLYASAADTLSKLSVGTNGDVLTLAAGVPSWATPAVTAAAQIKSQTTQPPGGINTDTFVGLEINSYVENITHSTITDNSEITIDLPGIYEITVNLSIWDGGGGGGLFTARLQENLAASPGWVETGAAIRRDGSNNSAGFASFMHMDRHAAGDKYRIVFIADTTAVVLQSFQPGVGTHPVSHPAVPSVDVHIKRIGL